MEGDAVRVSCILLNSFTSSGHHVVFIRVMFHRRSQVLFILREKNSKGGAAWRGQGSVQGSKI